MPKFDFEKVKEIAISFLHLTPKQNKILPFFVDHPYFESAVVLDNQGNQINILEDSESLISLQESIENRIQHAKDVYDILVLMRKGYHLTFLKYSKQYLDKHTFDELLSFMWINSENPNQDVNVSISTFIKWFKAADRKTIMSESEYKYYTALPDELNIYRGVAVGREESKGLSWTCNLDTAKWFSKRFDRKEEKGYILKGTIRKEDIFAYLNERGEDEILCNSSKVYNIEKI